jgi:hypothetical protein
LPNALQQYAAREKRFSLLSNTQQERRDFLFSAIHSKREEIFSSQQYTAREKRFSLLSYCVLLQAITCIKNAFGKCV